MEQEQLMEEYNIIKEPALTKFEEYERKMQQTIQQLEKESLNKKEWTMLGETNNKKRPQNSVLDDVIQVEYGNKPVPIITEQTTETLEDLIKKRIIEHQFDDPEARVKSTSTALNPVNGPKFQLNGEKSKESLAQIYEKEYMEKIAQQPSADTATLKKKHETVEKLWFKLCQKLDTLVAFGGGAKGILNSEIEIQTNIPSLQMEEIIPVAISKEQQLAPGEIYGKIGTGITKSQAELSTQEKNALRRTAVHRKRKVLAEKKKTEKLVDKLRPGLGNKYAKEKALRELSQNKNASLLDDKPFKNGQIGKASLSNLPNLNSSTAVFQHLTEEAQREAALDKPKNKSKKRKNQQLSIEEGDKVIEKKKKTR